MIGNQEWVPIMRRVCLPLTALFGQPLHLL